MTFTSLPPRLYADLIGKPFKDGGRGPDAYDCWGVLQVLAKRQGYAPTDYPSDPALLQAALADEWIEVPRGEVRPGDGILLRSMRTEYVWHIGVVVDMCRMIHARELAAVTKERFDSPAYVRRIVGFYRFRGCPLGSAARGS